MFLIGKSLARKTRSPKLHAKGSRWNANRVQCKKKGFRFLTFTDSVVWKLHEDIMVYIAYE